MNRPRLSERVFFVNCQSFACVFSRLRMWSAELNSTSRLSRCAAGSILRNSDFAADLAACLHSVTEGICDCVAWPTSWRRCPHQQPQHSWTRLESVTPRHSFSPRTQRITELLHCGRPGGFNCCNRFWSERLPPVARRCCAHERLIGSRSSRQYPI